MKLITYILGFFHKKQKPVKTYNSPRHIESEVHIENSDTGETLFRKIMGFEPTPVIGYMQSKETFFEQPKMFLGFDTKFIKQVI